MLKISENFVILFMPFYGIIEGSPSVKYFLFFKVFPLRPLRLCGGLNCYIKFKQKW